MDWSACTAHETNQDAYWISSDGRLAVVADGGARPDQHAEIASTLCCGIAAALYAPVAGDDLIGRIVREANHELLRRVVAGENVGTTSLSLVHISATGAVLAASFRDSPIVHGRDGAVMQRVRPRRQYDYMTDPSELSSLDSIFLGLGWKMRVPLEYHLPYADLSLDPAIERLAIQTGDVVVICTDGVSDLVSDGELVTHAAAQKLVRLARERGSRDDALCLVGR